MAEVKVRRKVRARSSSSSDEGQDDKTGAKAPPVPPRPTRASTIDFVNKNPKLKDASSAMQDKRQSSLNQDAIMEERGKDVAADQEGENDGTEEAPSRWRNIWQSTSNTMYSATSSVTNAVSTAKNATVNAAVTAKDATVNAAVTAKDATVAAAVKTKDVTINAAVTAKDATVSAAVKTKDATVTAATTAKDATVNAAVSAKDATVNATTSAKEATVSAASSTTNKLANVVVLAKKAAKDTKHRMGPAADTITIIHFNDVYNIESREQEPIGGAARFCKAVFAYDHLSPMILFSGDVFAPSLMSTFTKGEQMIPVLNKIGVHCACFGNHDFDFGVDVLMEHAEKTTFPWLISNVIDNETGRPLAEGKVSHIFDWWGRKIGIVGLVEKEWLDTLATINPSEVTYTDFVTAGNMLAKELKEKGCDYIIALTHMRTPNDVRLAENVEGIDLILGGHDHVYEKRMVNGKYILKSGTDFRQFSVVTVNFAKDEPAKVEIEAVEVTQDYEPDTELAAMLEKYSDRMDTELCKELGEFECDLDGRFSSIRSSETNLGNFVCDIMVASTNADLALLNSGTFRSDAIHPAGPFFLKDLLSILPMIDPLVLLEVTGDQIMKCLENGVSQYPKLEGRFPQVSGISFAFDPKKPSGQRVEEQFVRIGDEYLDRKRTYRMATKAYLADGKDGYDCLADAPKLVDDENGPTLTYAIQNHFKALAMREGKTRRTSVHHQSLVTLSRKANLVRQLTEDGKQHLPAHMPEKFKQSVLATNKAVLTKASTITDLENTNLNPRIKGRIKVLTPEVFEKLETKKKRHMEGMLGDFILEEDDEDDIDAHPHSTVEDLT